MVETDIHHPSNSTLLNDGVRLLSRTLQRARQVVADAGAVAQQAFVDPTQQARARMKQIMYVARLKGEQAADQVKTAYRDLLNLTRRVVEQAQQVKTQLHEQSSAAAKRVATTLETIIPRLQQVIQQTTRRVLQGEVVPAREKIVSLFEPHTAILRKGKAGKPTEFGREVWLDEVDGGIITRYAILQGNPDEKAQLVPSIEHHCQQFGRPLELVTADRGVQSAANERDAREAGVREVVLPKPGKKSAKRTAYEQQEWFVAGRNWRAGIEARISDLKRRQGLNRCRYHGGEGMERWVGLGLFAHNLRIIARHQMA